MGPTLAAFVYAVTSVLVGALLARPFLDRSVLLRGALVWSLNAALVFFLQNSLLVLLFSGILLAVIAPIETAKRVQLSILVLPSMPIYLSEMIPFPGINWLVVVNYATIVALACLLPTLFMRADAQDLGSGAYGRDAFAWPRSRQRKRNTFDAPLVFLSLFFLYAVAVAFAASGFTAGLRAVFDNGMLFLVPYLAISRGLKTDEDIAQTLGAIVAAAMILGCVAIISILKNWEFYKYLEPASVFKIPDLRSGFMRINATINTHSLGIICAVALLFFEYLRRRVGGSASKVWLVALVPLIAGLVLPDSKGALMALALGIFASACLRVESAGARTFLSMLFIGGVLIVGYKLAFEDVGALDPHGSAAYRQLLLAVSLEHLRENLLFGDVFFIQHPRFQVLMQGQGIIDITNYFLQIGLNYGFIGFTLLFGAFSLTMTGLARRILAGDQDRNLQVALLAAIIGWLGIMTTTSDSGRTVQFGIILLALGRAASSLRDLSDALPDKGILLSPLPVTALNSSRARVR